MKNILVVEDDIYIGNMTEEALKAKGYNVLRAYSGTEALLKLTSDNIDLVLLDLMLPGLSGEEVLPKIKNIPVIIVSAKTDIDDKVELLSVGATDYITKPFDIRELLARIEVQLRNPTIKNTEITYKNIVIDTSAHSVTVSNAPAKLTKTEYAILIQLLLNPTQVVTKSHLIGRKLKSWNSPLIFGFHPLLGNAIICVITSLN